MRYFLALMILLPLLAQAGGDSHTRSLVAVLAEIDSIAGGFQQTILDQGGQRLQEARGDMVVARGNRFRWHTREPFEQLALSDGNTVWVHDPDLEQVIINLVRNALDAMKGADLRELDILLTVGRQVVLTFRDTGDGIENLEELFEPFYTTKKPGEGVGLGLAISSGIITDLGGRLSARNGREGGAVFEITLPILDAEANRDATTAAE